MFYKNNEVHPNPSLLYEELTPIFRPRKDDHRLIDFIKSNLYPTLTLNPHDWS